ncbi:MAG TPA: glycosyltransferase family 2 protein [Anaerolineaceae bacterium]|nr:glycosyltransferase family 2 protein [Anaerolineaceae bacterium]
MNKTLLDIVIINWNSADLLQNCVASIRTSSIALPGELIVVDNGKKEQKVDDLANQYSFTLLRPEKNLGFGRGCNQGAALGKADFILFLNPDILLFPDTLQNLTTFLSSDNLPADVGIMGVQLIGRDGNIQKNVARFPQCKHLYPRMLALDRLFPKAFPPHYVKTIDYGKTQIVDQVPGAFFLIRRIVFSELHGFDERFFMYYEDVDLSYRAFQQDWKTIYLSEISVMHAGGGATDRIQGKRLFYLLRSRAMYVRKHFGLCNAILVILATLCLEFLARIIRALFHLSPKEIWITISAHALFFINIPAIVRNK